MNSLLPIKSCLEYKCMERPDWLFSLGYAWITAPDRLDMGSRVAPTRNHNILLWTHCPQPAGCVPICIFMHFMFAWNVDYELIDSHLKFNTADEKVKSTLILILISPQYSMLIHSTMACILKTYLFVPCSSCWREFSAMMKKFNSSTSRHCWRKERHRSIIR